MPPYLFKERNQGTALARTLVWWPGIDREVEELLHRCTVCQQAAPMPPSTEPLAWPATKQPWTRVHVDYAGPVEGKMILVVVDSFSGWIEALPATTATSATTVELLRTTFARFGLPTCLVSDNGTPFTGAEYQDFVKKNGIRHIRAAPYQPQSNGLAERAVRSVKDGLKRVSGASLTTRLARWLHMHRRMPSGGRPKSPAEMLLAYQPKVRLDLLTARAESNKPAGPANQSPTWSRGQAVFARNFGNGPCWPSGTITEELGNRMALVQTPAGMIRRHHDQLRLRHEVNTPDPLHLPSERNEDLMLEWGQSSAAPETSRATLEPSKEQRPVRQRRPPVRLNL